MRKEWIAGLVALLWCSVVEARTEGVLPSAQGSALPEAEVERCEKPVQNLIFMIGDGMGLSQVSMLSIENDYRQTAFDRAQNVALLVTRSANNRVTDSAAAGTALATGHKTNNGMIGMRPDSTPVASLIERASQLGRPTGVVVTCLLQHATPAAFYAHVPSRRSYQRISDQLAESGLTLALGGGRSYAARSEEGPMTGLERLQERGYAVLERPSQLDTIARTPVMGFFAEGHLPSMLQGRGDFLPRATRTALRLLEGEADSLGTGFVLMVEGSQIDMEVHANRADGVLAEMQDFERAVAAAVEFTRCHPGTLLVVTADHETGGLFIPSSDSDFEQAEKGIDLRFGTEGHTAAFVPVFLYGTGAERINGVMENTELSARLMELLGLSSSPR